jgi:hypothetical protein
MEAGAFDVNDFVLAGNADRPSRAASASHRRAVTPEIGVGEGG